MRTLNIILKPLRAFFEQEGDEVEDVLSWCWQRNQKKHLQRHRTDEAGQVPTEHGVHAEDVVF